MSTAFQAPWKTPGRVLLRIAFLVFPLRPPGTKAHTPHNDTPRVFFTPTPPDHCGGSAPAACPRSAPLGLLGRAAKQAHAAAACPRRPPLGLSGAGLNHDTTRYETLCIAPSRSTAVNSSARAARGGGRLDQPGSRKEWGGVGGGEVAAAAGTGTGRLGVWEARSMGGDCHSLTCTVPVTGR